MSKNLKELQLAIQALLEDIEPKVAKPEGEPNDPFGQYFNAPQRLDVPSPREPNTQQEDKFVEALRKHISFNENQLDEYAGLLKQLKASGKYRKFLNPVPGTVYRFIQVPRSKAMEILGIDEMEPNKIVVQNKSGVLKPTRREAQSWTYAYSQEVFEYVRDGGMHDNALIGFISDTTKGDFYFNWQELAKQKLPTPESSNLLKKEKEVVSFGPVAYIKSFYFVQEKRNTIRPNENIILNRFNNVSKKSVQQTSEKILSLLLETQKVADEFKHTFNELQKDPDFYNTHLKVAVGDMAYYLAFCEQSLFRAKSDFGWNIRFDPSNLSRTNAQTLIDASNYLYKACRDGFSGFDHLTSMPDNLKQIKEKLLSVMDRSNALYTEVANIVDKDKKILMKLDPAYWDTTHLRKASRKVIK